MIGVKILVEIVRIFGQAAADFAEIFTFIGITVVSCLLLAPLNTVGVRGNINGRQKGRETK